MVNLPNVFSETSDGPYDRHYYKVLLKNNTIKKFDYYDDARNFWFQNSRIPDFLDIITVHDKSTKKGF